MKNTLLQEGFELIKSLTKNEKRYFKLFTRFQQGDKSYMKLFDILDKQKEFNEKAIDKKFLIHSKTTNYPLVKKYLFDQIILALKSYGSYKDLDSDHTDLIETYKVLQYKGLHGQSDKLLKKIKAITIADDAFIRHYYVLLLEYRQEVASSEDAGSQNIQQIFEARKRTLRIIQNYSWVGDLFSYQRVLLRKKLYCRTKQEKQKLAELMKPLLQSSESDMLSRTALGLRNMALCDYYTAIGKPKKAFQTSKIYLELRQNAGSMDKVEDQTISEYSNHISLCVRNKFFESFEEDIAKFKTFIDRIRNWNKHAIGYERWFIYLMVYYNRTGQFEKLTALLNEENKKLREMEGWITMKGKITIWYFTAYHHFALNEYKQALKLIQKIMNEAEADVEEYSFAKLLIMFIHYELKNFELLEYQVRSAQRMMEKTERLYQCEKLILDYFKNQNAISTKKQQQENLLLIRQKVNTLFKSHNERGFSFYFDIQSWLESKLQNRAFADVVKNPPSPLWKRGN